MVADNNTTTMNDSTINTHDNGMIHLDTFDARRRFKAAVYAVSLGLIAHAALEKTKEEEKPRRVVGKKFSSRRTTATTTTTAQAMEARQKVRAAIKAIVAIQELQKRLEAKHCTAAQPVQQCYEEPVYDWEDTAIPLGGGKPSRSLTKPRTLAREVSLSVTDMFMESNVEYLVRLAEHKFLSICDKVVLRMKEEEDKQKQTHKPPSQMKSLVYVVMAAQELSRALDLNMHPRNRFSSVQHTLAAQAILLHQQSQGEDYDEEDDHKDMHQQRRESLTSLVDVILAGQELGCVMDYNMHPRNRYQGMNHVLAAQVKLSKKDIYEDDSNKEEEIEKPLFNPRLKFRAAVEAIIAAQRLMEAARGLVTAIEHHQRHRRNKSFDNMEGFGSPRSVLGKTSAHRRSSSTPMSSLMNMEGLAPPIYNE